MTDRELLAAVARGLNGISSAQSVAARLGYRPAHNGRLATSSRLRAAERRGLVGRIPPKDQFDHADWFLTDAGKAALAGS